MPTSSFFKPIGVSGLDRLYGFVREEFAKDLQGELWRRVIREMSEQDPTVGAVLYAVEMLMRQAKWEVVSTSDSMEALRWQKFFEQALFEDMDYSWEDTLAEAISMLEWGWSYLEIVYKRRNGDQRDPTRRSNFDDNLIGWRKWEIRAQDTLYNWEYDVESDDFLGMVQQAPPNYTRTLIPIEKSLHFKTTSRKANPEGRSVLRRAYLPWYFKKNIQRIEAIGIERDLAGLPMVECPPELLADDSTLTPAQRALKTALTQLVQSVRRDASEGLVFPLAYDSDGHQLYRFSLLSSGGARQFDTSSIVRRYDESIAMTMLADFIFLGHGTVGSWALSSSKTSLFSNALGAILDSIQQVINQFAIPRLAKLNNVPREYWPRVQHGDVETVDLTELGGYIAQLSGAGFNLVGLQKVLPYLLQQAGIPVPDEEELNAQDMEDEDEPTDEELDVLNQREDQLLAAREELSQRFAKDFSDSALDSSSVPDELLDAMVEARNRVLERMSE